MHAAIGFITRAATSDASVLLRGESGTGKGVLARALHSMSARRKRPFVTINCPTLSEQTAGERAVRPRARRLHGRGEGPAGARGAGGRGHALPG
ncbi:sigma 54-interacting transcriptional regulator [Corallococcus exiguus]|uniref:sigma 54-interacting transcriptional regulator n=1 Tax=Corallococcus exiguus TaxID=83462 RepID=UPI001A8C0C37|nr:sigma 54-interacting transcriptional regulator [Corallococcus exiguus]MBN8473148.1 sigma 54-interacting transcriptional regulator [Corallococcus exiguus]